MAISIKGKLADKAIELLGGRNVTEKRIEGLLAELEESRAALAAYKAIHEPAPDVLGSAKILQPSAMGDLAVPILTLGLTEGELGAEADDWDEAEPTPEDPAVLARHLEVPLLPDVGNQIGPRVKVIAKDATSFTLGPVVDPAHIAPPSPTLSPEMQAMQAMMEMVQVLKAEVQAMKAAPTEAEKKEAIAGGKLPSIAPIAGPVGYTGSAQLPRGKWFPSPLGPGHIQMRLCDCTKCGVKVNHYFCVICRRGPFGYLGPTGPKGRKQYFAPSSTWGVVHECCSVTCYMRYLEAIGIAPGINDAEPPTASTTEQPMVALGSD